MKNFVILKPLITFWTISCLWSCDDPNQQEAAIAEISAIEKAFNDYAEEYNVKEAFLKYSADDAVLKRGGKIIKGKEGIRQYFEDQPYSEVKLTWKPDFIDAAASGDMAYTYGTYEFSALDSLQQPVHATGIFHTIWKRQADGSWKFVYD